MRVGDNVDFDPATGEVRRGERLSRLEPQPSAVLALLASRPGQLVGHDEMRRAIWGDATHVNFQQNLHYCIREIRSALGDDARHSQFIETIPRRGYRLIAPIGAAGRADERAGAFAQLDRPGRARALWTAVAIVLILAAVFVEQRPNRHHEVTVGFLRAVHELVF